MRLLTQIYSRILCYTSRLSVKWWNFIRAVFTLVLFQGRDEVELLENDNLN